MRIRIHANRITDLVAFIAHANYILGTAFVMGAVTVD